MKALILDNKVVDVVVTEFEVHSSMTWMDCPDDCIHGWTLIDGVLTAPAARPALTYSELRRNKYNLLNQDEMRFDDQVNGTTTWVDAINAIKAAHPKP
jgi:hypothetical protein|tara:strand:+ start:1382 stop:1675 length:294 start_codon:yes stop_codon:yes gene_type:complete